MVFAGGQLLPGDVARAILGPLADARAVANLDHQLGLDRPLWIQYWEWISHFARGDMGESYVYRAPVAPFVLAALGYSVKLGAVAFVLVVPLSIASGVWSALRAGGPIDRIISLIGLSATILPEFVSGIVLIMIFGIWLKILPVTAQWPAGATLLTQIHYLLLPSLPLVLVLFGYLARMARAGTLEALAADYTRTAVLKGLKPRAVLLQTRPQERAAADDHGHRHAARISHGRPRGRRNAVPLSGHRRLDLRRCARSGFPDAGGRRVDGRDHLRRWRV